MNAIIDCLVGFNYETIASESDLQRQVEDRLRSANIEFRSQVQLDAKGHDRIDVLCGSTGIELKIKGSASGVLAQLERYAISSLVSEIILVTTRASHLKIRDVESVHGKRIYVVYVGSL
jgi:hypothetical protein